MPRVRPTPKPTVTSEELDRQLGSTSPVRLSAADWSAVAEHFEQVARHRTSVAGDLLIMRGESGLFAVEQPTPDTRVVRILQDESEADRFVVERLGQYERMWDGCGCRIDYHSLDW